MSQRKYIFDIYLRKVLKQVHPDIDISTKTINTMNIILHYLLNEILSRAQQLIIFENKKTISARDIQAAVRLFVSGELGKHAISEGTKAVVKFGASFGRTNMPYGRAALRPSAKNEKLSKSKRAGLTFGVGRVRSLMKHISCARIGSDAPIYLAATLEYLAAELLELAGNACIDHKKKRINDRMLKIAILNDDELKKLFKKVDLPGGVLPVIQILLLKKK